MSERLYSYEEYAELMDGEVRSFYVACRLAAHKNPEDAKSRPLDEWDQVFDDFLPNGGRRWALDKSAAKPQRAAFRYYGGKWKLAD